MRVQAAELVALKLDVFIAGSQNAARALKRQTSTIPIVFVNLADPVGSGLVSSLASSGANVTGFTAFEFKTAGKWVELIKEIEPRLTRAAFIFGGSDFGATGENFYTVASRSAAALSLELVPIRITATMTRADIETRVSDFPRNPAAA